jgi:pteridine reductase
MKGGHVQDTLEQLNDKVALITGAAQRIGAEIARCLHGAGMKVVLHYRGSQQAAQALATELNQLRAGSATLLQADLSDSATLVPLVEAAGVHWGRLDALVNNASTFYSTPMGTVTLPQWQDLMDVNLRAPFFLAQAAAPLLTESGGCIVNIADIHADRPLKEYPVYCMAKAGLVMMTRALARELGPAVRVNAVAPGAILWPEVGLDEVAQASILARTALKRQGNPEDIASAVLFLIRDSKYITGQVLSVDGGRSLGY